MNDDQQPEWVAPGSIPPVAPPPAASPGYPPYPGQPYPPQGYYPPQYFRPVHKPGIIALRPLGLGDMYDGAFNAIRRNPKPMVGLAALVATSAVLVPALVTVLLALTGDLTLDLESDSTAVQVVTNAGSVLTALAAVVLTGMIVFVVMEASLGRKATIEGTWRAVRGRMLRLVALSLLTGLTAVLLIGTPIVIGIVLGMAVDVVLGVVAGILGFVAAACLTIFLWVRLVMLAPPAMVIERHGVFGSMRRSWALTRRQFWRIFGIGLLTQVIAGFVGQILAIPLAIVGVASFFVFDNSTVAGLVYVFSTYISLILTQALTTPFIASVQALQYVDQRIRKEAYDVELIARAQPAPAA